MKEVESVDVIKFRDGVIKRGLESVVTEKEKYAREGGKEGFELCRTLDTREDFLRVLNERLQEELNLIKKYQNGKLKIDDYWRYRWATIQIEWVFNIMDVIFRGIGLV